MKTKPRQIIAPFGSPRKDRNPTIMAACLRVAQAKKDWANVTINDEQWKAGASGMSLSLLNDCHTKTVEQLAAYDYDYWEHRASLTYNPYGGPQVVKTDQQASSMWDGLVAGDPSLYFKHYDCYLT